MTETYKIFNVISPPIMEKKYIFRKNTHNVRNVQKISKGNRKILKYGIETTSNRTPFLCANLPNKYKMAVFLNDFKVKIKTWHCNKGVCRL